MDRDIAEMLLAMLNAQSTSAFSDEGLAAVTRARTQLRAIIDAQVSDDDEAKGT
jgi:hypothetical protein